MTDKENIDKQIELFDILYQKYQADKNFCFTIPNLSKSITALPSFFYKPNEYEITVSFWKCGYCKIEYQFIGNQLAISALHPIAKKFVEKILLTLFPNHSKNVEAELLFRYNSIDEFLSKDKSIIDKILAEEISQQPNPMLPNIGIAFLYRQEFETNLSKSLVIRKRYDDRKIAGNIRIKKLILSNIGHFSDQINIDFSQKITCIIGENGSGKSTILRALGLVLCGIDSSPLLESSNVWNSRFVRIKGKSNFGFEIFPENAFISLNYELDNKNFAQNIVFDNFNGFNTIENEGDFINVTSTNHFKTLTIGFPQVQGKIEKTTNGNLRNTEGNIKDILPLILNEADNRFEEFSKWLIQLYATGNQQKANGVINPSPFQIIETIFSIISAITGSQIAFLSVNHESETVWVTTDDAPNGIPLSLISQGYNNVFGWIGFLVKRLAETNPNSPDFTKEPAMVFIDEIDTYLHPEWQRTILRVLVDTFTATQFVITTHSFAVATSVPDIKIYRLEKQSNHTIICKEFTDYKPYGMDANDALVQLMDTPNRAAKDANEDINRLFRLIENNQLTEAQNFLSLLTEKYDSRDSKLVEAEMLIDTKKLLQL